jgi:nucleoside 2-deoxyribosyltransferase
MSWVYLAGAITGHSFKEANAWRTLPTFTNKLVKNGWHPLSPLEGLDHLKDEKALDAYCEGVDPGLVVSKDLDMIDLADAVIANLRIEGPPSIGTMFELGYAYAHRKPIIVIRDDVESVYDHPFIDGTASQIVFHLDGAIEALCQLQEKDRVPANA